VWKLGATAFFRGRLALREATIVEYGAIYEVVLSARQAVEEFSHGLDPNLMPQERVWLPQNGGSHACGRC
jgi:hypothetical protein